MTNKKYLIVGAGPVGLTLAIFFKLNNIPFDILDSKSEPVKDSRALGVHARTLELLSPTGLDKILISNGKITAHMQFHKYSKPLFSLPFDILAKHTPYPYYLIVPQAQTEKILCNWLLERDVNIRWNSKVLSVETSVEHIDLIIQDNLGQEISATYDFVFACDGANSVIRENIGIKFSGETYSANFLLAEANIDDQKKIDSNSTHVFLSKNTTVAVIPLPNGKFRLVGPDFSNNKKELINFDDFKEFLNQNNLLTNVNLLNPERVVSYRMHKRVADRFYLNRVFLLGDAAHIHSPAGGQGMNTGMQDAINLAWKFSLFSTGLANSDILESYASERRQNAIAVVSNTDKAMAMVLSKKIKTLLFIRRIVPLVLKVFTPHKIMQDMSQLSINYQINHSTAAKIDEINIGHRLPWLKLNDKLDSFSLSNGTNFIIYCSGLTKGEIVSFIDDTSRIRKLLGQRLLTVFLNIKATPNLSLPDFCSQIQTNIETFKSLKDKAGRFIVVRPDNYIQSVFNQPHELLNDFSFLIGE